MFGVVRSFLNKTKEIVVNVMAAMERPAHVRSIVMRTLVCSELSDSGAGASIVVDHNSGENG